MRNAIEQRDGTSMEAALATLTSTCHACHQAERVAFVTVVPPTLRSSPVQLFSPTEPVVLAR